MLRFAWIVFVTKIAKNVQNKASIYKSHLVVGKENAAILDINKPTKFSNKGNLSRYTYTKLFYVLLDCTFCNQMF